jgi:hypothetical protein
VNVKRPRVITQQQREALGALYLTLPWRDKSAPLIELPGDYYYARELARSCAQGYINRLHGKEADKSKVRQKVRG